MEKIGFSHPLPPIDWNLFTFVGIRDTREDRRRAKLAGVSKEESTKESLGEGEGKVEREEGREWVEVSTAMGGEDL